MTGSQKDVSGLDAVLAAMADKVIATFEAATAALAPSA